MSEAHVLKWILTLDLLLLICQFGTAEPTLAGFSMPLELCAIFACMIRLNSAARAEALVTSSAFDTMLSHVHSCSWRNDLALVVFGVVVNLSRLNFHHIAARTSDKIGILIHKGFKMKFVDFFERFF